METITVTLTIIAVALAVALAWGLVSARRAMVGRGLETSMRTTADELAQRRSRRVERDRSQPRAA